MRRTSWVLAAIRTTLRRSQQLDMLWSWLVHDTKDDQSPYVMTSNTRPLVARGEWMAHTNEKMAQRIQKLVTHIVKEQDIEWKWVKGHDNIVGNERADGLAKCGTEGKYHNAHDDGAWTALTVAANHTVENSQIENITTTKFCPPPFSGSPFTAEDSNTAADYKRGLKETGSNIPQIQTQSKACIYSTGLHGTGRSHGGSRRGKVLQTSSQTWSPNWKDSHDEAWSLTVCNKSRPTSLSWAATLTLLQMQRLNKGLPQLPCDYTLDTAPHDAEILHELNRMKHSAPGEDEVTSSMYRSLSPLGKRVLCQRLRDLLTSPTHTWSSSLHSTLGFRLHKKGCRHDMGNYRTLWLISVIVRLLCRILAARVSFIICSPFLSGVFVPTTRPRAQPCFFVVLQNRPMPLGLAR